MLNAILKGFCRYFGGTVILLCVFLPAGCGGRVVFESSFEEEISGSGLMTVAETNGEGKPAVWEVVRDDSAPDGGSAIAITKTDNTRQTYNLLLSRDVYATNVEIYVKVKALTGKEDQGGGPVWRVKDEGNYYIARWNPLEDNFRVYYVKDSRRRQIGSANVKVDPKLWHEIKIRHVGNFIQAWLDGVLLIEVNDETFGDGGNVGLWTKADAATSFDLLVVTEIE